jgi:hypothetical protein
LPAISTRGQPTKYSIEMLTTFPGGPSVGLTLTTRGAQAEDDVVTDRQATKIKRYIFFFNRWTKHFMHGSPNSLMA